MGGGREGGINIALLYVSLTEKGAQARDGM